MINISIACLIYKSTKWLDFVYKQITKYTNLIDNEFYFVANDACDKVLKHLKLRVSELKHVYFFIYFL